MWEVDGGSSVGVLYNDRDQAQKNLWEYLRVGKLSTLRATNDVEEEIAQLLQPVETTGWSICELDGQRIFRFEDKYAWGIYLTKIVGDRAFYATATISESELYRNTRHVKDLLRAELQHAIREGERFIENWRREDGNEG